MAVATSNAQALRIGIQELDLKMKLERPFRAEIKAILKTISDDFFSDFASSGIMINVENYKTDIEAILKKNYRKIGKVFSKSIRRQEKDKKFFIETKQLDDRIDAEVTRYITTRAPEQAAIITATTARLLVVDIIEAGQSVLGATGTIDREAVADVAWSSNVARAEGRSVTISETETQNMAETSKNIEATNLIAAGIVASVIKPIPDKVWHAFLDEKTRTPHAIADGQVRAQNEPFVVSGQSLMFPGDGSRGASIANLANCRCWTTLRLT